MNSYEKLLEVVGGFNSEIKNVEELEEKIKIINQNVNSSKHYESETPKHYNNNKGSLYNFAEEKELNAWEFDCIKRIVRSRKKGEFESDIKKTIVVLELYLKEYNKQ
jgi:hypothetical protein